MLVVRTQGAMGTDSQAYSHSVRHPPHPGAQPKPLKVKYSRPAVGIATPVLLNLVSAAPASSFPHPALSGIPILFSSLFSLCAVSPSTFF